MLSEDEMEDLQESLMDVLCKAKKNAKKRHNDSPPVKITNLLSSPTSQNGYTQSLQALTQYPALRDYSYTQSTSQERYSFLQSSSFKYNTRYVISDIDTEGSSKNYLVINFSE